jgi:hypothetical protein
MYWYGELDAEDNNMSTCIWQSRKHATASIARPYHIAGARLAAAAYDSFTLERHVIRKVKGETGITIEPYTGGEVGW